MRRAAVSAPSNIAEGQSQKGLRACLNYLGIALGSLAELDTQVEVALRLAYVPTGAAHELKLLIDSARRLTHGLRRAKRRRLALAVGSAGTVLCLALRLFT
jgi:four helix bundle protein